LRRGVITAAVGVGGIALTWIGHWHGALEPWQPVVAQAGVFVAAVALFRAVGHFTPVVLRLAARWRVFQRGPAKVALANLLREPKRTSVIAVAVGTAVGLACVLGSLLPAIADGARMFSGRSSQGRVWVSSLPSNNSALIDSKTPAAVHAAIARMPGVARLDRLMFISLTSGQFKGQGSLVGVNGWEGPVNKYTVYDGGAPDAALARGEVMVGPALARSRHLRAGSTLVVPGRTGMVTLHVGGVWGDPNGLGQGITMTVPMLESIWGEMPTSELYVTPAPGVTPAELARRIHDAHLDVDVRALTPSGLAADIAKDVQGFITPFWALQRAMLLVAIIATLSTMLLVGVQRRREEGLLAALGMGPVDLALMTLVEAGAVGLVASVLGAVASVGAYLALSFVAPILTGLQPPFHIDLLAPVAYGALATACVVAGAAWPAWRTSKLDVLTALQYG
jgi:putative ABC transport system permease protein